MAGTAPVPCDVPKPTNNAVNLPICICIYFAEAKKQAQGNATALQQIAYMKGKCCKLYAYKKSAKLAHQKELRNIYNEAILEGMEETADTGLQKAAESSVEGQGEEEAERDNMEELEAEGEAMEEGLKVKESGKAEGADAHRETKSSLEVEKTYEYARDLLGDHKACHQLPK
ncbi:hypothetical protein CBOM_06378 [Ceraceosorus bombacis]|uniref:Uncharacterized protein n=1 Tax=Ceraceosorus bombacis TaxID=401625 RepID=A0A0P1BJX0_9BASI|nr:hypothetical protein CBOM_06378 [Ceraceosorus bombacis]